MGLKEMKGEFSSREGGEELTHPKTPTV